MDIATGSEAKMPSPKEALTGCTRCGKPMPRDRIFFSDDGKVICRLCSEELDLQATDRRIASSVRNTAFGTPALAIFSLLFDPFFIITIVSMCGAIGSLIALSRSKKIRENLGGQSPFVIAACVLALLIASLNLLKLLVLFLVLVRSVVR